MGVKLEYGGIDGYLWLMGGLSNPQSEFLKGMPK
jgi:hypothetical protein